MPGDLNINLNAEWLETEADGEPCSHCGDRCFLRQHTLFLSLVRPLQRGPPTPALQLCGSCYEALLPQLRRLNSEF